MNTEASSEATTRDSVICAQLTKDVSTLGVWVLASLGTVDLILPSGIPNKVPDSVALTAPHQPERSLIEDFWLSYAGYQPRTPLGRRILEARKRLAAGGFKFLSLEELDREMRTLRERGFEV